MADYNDIDQVSPNVSAVAMGANAYEHDDFDFAKLVLDAFLGAIDSLLGHNETAPSVPYTTMKAIEAVHAIGQHFIVAAAAPFVFSELGKSEPHPKPIVDAKLRAELRISRANLIAIQNAMDAEPSEDHPSTPAAASPADELIRSERGTSEAAANPDGSARLSSDDDAAA